MVRRSLKIIETDNIRKLIGTVSYPDLNMAVYSRL